MRISKLVKPDAVGLPKTIGQGHVSYIDRTQDHFFHGLLSADPHVVDRLLVIYLMGGSNSISTFVFDLNFQMGYHVYVLLLCCKLCAVVN